MEHDASLNAYLQLSTLVPSREEPGNRSIGTLSPPAAWEAVDRFDLQDASAANDRLLLAATREGDAGAFLCLRCRVSTKLNKEIRSLHKKYNRSYGLDLISMATFVLDDNGRALSFASFDGLATATIAPFTAQVICSFDPDRQAGLPHWAGIKLQAHNSLKSYLREHGLLLISEWALLAVSSSRRVREAWQNFGVGALTADRAVALHAAYTRIYAQAKAEHRARTARSAGWTPSPSFWLEMAPEQPANLTEKQMKAIEQTVRRLVSQRWQWNRAGPDDHDPVEAVPDPASLHPLIEVQDAETEEQLGSIHSALEQALASVMPSVLEPAAVDPQLHCLWQGFSQGLTNGPLSERCGCARGTVSKKLRPEKLATAIARQAAVTLCRQRCFADVARSAEGVERMVEALRNHLLTPEREGDVAPLRRWVHDHLPKP